METLRSQRGILHLLSTGKNELWT